MNRTELLALLASELEHLDGFTNHHGINQTNLRSHLIDPYLILVDPDDLESEPREMWAVLRESRANEEGYVLAFDPLILQWAVVEHTGSGGYIQVVSSSTLAGALDGM